MEAMQIVRRVRNKISLSLPFFKYLNPGKEKFTCPICLYEGPFVDFHSFAGVRNNAVCPRCGAFERHRLQHLVVRDIVKDVNLVELKMLHFAPEQCLMRTFSEQFANYQTADLFMEDVDHRVDIRNLPFADGTYDLVFASHVLEHLREDRKAVQEIRRVLKPNGVAILPVPIVCTNTIEYPEANPHEAGHVRAPGLDYFERYKEYFRSVRIHTSELYPEKHQLFIYEDRSLWPTKECPLRPPMPGKMHSDFVPVCYA